MVHVQKAKIKMRSCCFQERSRTILLKPSEEAKALLKAQENTR